MSDRDSSFANTLTLAGEMTPRQLARTKPLPLIIDIREEQQFASGHIAGAEHISRDDLELKVTEIAPELSTPILVYCAVGSQAPLAAEKLAQMGYRNVSSLKGGLQSWLEAGGMVECLKSASLAGIY